MIRAWFNKWMFHWKLTLFWTPKYHWISSEIFKSASDLVPLFWLEDSRYKAVLSVAVLRFLRAELQGQVQVQGTLASLCSGVPGIIQSVVNGFFHVLIGISTTMCSFVGAPHNFNTSLLLHLKNFPIGHLLPIVVNSSHIFFRNFHPGVTGHYW